MSINKYDCIVVGSGFVGAILAYFYARNDKSVLVLERRNHIAGNMYDELDAKTDVLVQKYGPHSFHTNNERVYEVLKKNWEWDPIDVISRVSIDGKFTPSPFNLTTVDQFFSLEEASKIKEHLKLVYGKNKVTTIVDMLDSSDEVVRGYAKFLFEEDYKPYTVKQWGIKPEDLDINILKRVPVRLTYEDINIDDKYKIQPQKGYTAFFEKLLNHPNINLMLNCDARNHLSLDDSGRLFFDDEEVRVPLYYSGALDELFEFKYGKLPYRSLEFKYEYGKKGDIPAVCIAYPKAEGYTRVTDFMQLMTTVPETNQTILLYEYPVECDLSIGDEPYYPILTDESKDRYNLYLEESMKYKYLIPCGRLGDFKYYNMDQAVVRALELLDVHGIPTE